MLTMMYQRAVVFVSVESVRHLHAVVPGRFEAERGDACGQRDIVVDRPARATQIALLACVLCEPLYAGVVALMVTRYLMPVFCSQLRRALRPAWSGFLAGVGAVGPQERSVAGSSRV